MSRNRLNFSQINHRNGDNIMNSSNIHYLQQRPAANQEPAAKVVVRRGPQLMVVFQSCPKAADVDALLMAGVKVGLALSPRDLTKASKLDDYSYVFTGMGRKGKSSLGQAIADLAHNGWSVDDQGQSGFDWVEPRAPRAPLKAMEQVQAHA